ncbi:hypothetical protein [Streptomyces ziwulingensis]|uniref:Secreted protein n=1 Tax=Streptomyces ziwulingensis TaxID=1045501 RepID=A0ABP9CEL6_9ACTN
MIVLLIVLAVVFLGLGFLEPLWWLAAAAMLYGVTRHRRTHGGFIGRGGRSDAAGYRDYQQRRDRTERWDRRYSRNHRARRRREDRRDHGGRK